MSDDVLADRSEIPEMSSRHAEGQEVSETKVRNLVSEQPVTATQSDNSDLSQPVRRSEKTHQPSKRLDYPLLGKPLVTIVRSLFQGLSKAFAESLMDDDKDCYLRSQAFEMTTPIVE